MTVLDIIRAHIDAHGLNGDSTAEIVREFLKGWEYDGLCCEDCGCTPDDLSPCVSSPAGGSGVADCEPGHTVKCADCPRRNSDEACTDGVTEGGSCILADAKTSPDT